MNKFFKVSLVAAAIAVSGTATAGVFTTDTSIYSSEGIAITTATEQMAADVVYTFATDYEAAATLKFTFSAGAIGAGAVFEDSVVVAALSTGTVTFTKSAQDATSVTYTLTAKTSDATTLLGAAFTIKGATSLSTIDGLTFNTAAVAAGNITVVANSEFSGVAFDPDTTTAAAVDADNNIRTTTATQFGVFATSALADGVIALTASNELGKVIDDADTITVAYDDTAVTATLALVGADDSVGNDLSAVELTTAYEVIGNYAGFSKTQIADSAVLTETTSITANGLKVTQAAGSSIVDGTLVVTPASTNDALVVQRFNVVPTIAYADQVVPFTTLPAGQWTVDAETVNIPYMPYAEGISQIIYVTNTAAVDANVSAVATDENGTSYALGVIGVAKAGGAVTKFTKDIKDALIAQGFTTGKLSIDLVFAGIAPVANDIVIGDAGATVGAAVALDLVKGQIKVNSAYNVGGTDRGFVSNTTNGSN